METDKYTKIDRSRASLILGAVGDALGVAVEFMKRDEIIAKYGDSPNAIKGIQFPDEAYGKKGAITDDTQMTLFAADGLLSAENEVLHEEIDRLQGVLKVLYTWATVDNVLINRHVVDYPRRCKQCQKDQRVDAP
jgi:ADP-ribosylglycohydrolase